LAIYSGVNVDKLSAVSALFVAVGCFLGTWRVVLGETLRSWIFTDGKFGDSIRNKEFTVGAENEGVVTYFNVDEPIRVTFFVDDNNRGQSQKSLLLSEQVSELVNTITDVGHAHRPGNEPVDGFCDPGDSQNEDSDKVIKDVEVAERNDFTRDLFNSLNDFHNDASPAGDELSKQVCNRVLCSVREEKTPASADTTDGSCPVGTEVFNCTVEFGYK